MSNGSSDFFAPARLDARAESALDVRAAARARVPGQLVVVDLSDRPAQAKVVREGFQVPEVTVDPRKASFFVDNLVETLPRESPRVVVQSLPAGTRVSPGTAVDLVLAEPRAIPFNIFAATHADLRERNVQSVIDGVLDDADTRRLMLQYATADEVPAADKTRLTQSFANLDIGIDDADAERSFARAFTTVRTALAFR